MSYNRRRGRPKADRPKLDMGTPELQHKRSLHLTAEALDLCYERGLISKDQHWCGVHFRWLYTLRYGAPGVRATDPLHLGGRELAPDSPEWRHEREEEYRTAIESLKAIGKVTPILRLCIFNQRPQCLHPLSFGHSASDVHRQDKTIAEIAEGLDALMDIWCAPQRVNSYHSAQISAPPP